MSELLLGKYKFLETLGAGGMGRVDLALDSRLQRKVAIKRMLNPGVDFAYFKREARLLAKLNHPHIVQLYDYIETSDPGNAHREFAIVMEYVEGIKLSELIKLSDISSAKAMQWLIEIASALFAAHSKGIVHADLKAENILIDNQQAVKVADFGIARTLGGTQTLDVKNLSSINALSPEHIEGKDLTAQSDLFALGIIAYQLACGKHPFHSGNFAATIHSTLHRTPAPPHRLNSAVPEGFSGLIMKLLEKIPENRPTSAQELRMTLQSIRDDLDDVHPKCAVDTIEVTSGYYRKGQKLRSLSGAFFPGKRPKQRYFLPGMACALLVLLCVMGYWWKTRAHQPTYVLVYPSETAVEPQGTESYKYIQSSLELAVEQFLIESKTTALVPLPSGRGLQLKPVELARQLGADRVLTSSVDCIASKCEVEMMLFHPLSNTVIGKRRWSVLPNDPLSAAIAAQKQTGAILSIEAPGTLAKSIDSLSYNQYLDLYLELYDSSTQFERDLSRVKTLINSAPGFAPAYKLYAHIGFRAYNQTREPNYLSLIAQQLQSAHELLTSSMELKLINLELLILKGSYAQAEQLLETLYKNTLGTDEYLFNRAKIRAREGNLSQAIVDYEASLALRPSMDALRRLIISYWLVGQYDKANGAIERLLRISPGNLFAKEMQGSVALLQGRLSDAVSVFESIIEQSANAQNMSDLGIAYMLQGQYDSAIHYLSRALQLAPENTAFMLNLADANNAAGNASKAGLLYNNVIDTLNRNSSGDLETLSSLAQAFAHTDRNREAIYTAQKLLADYEDSTNALFAAALVYSVIGETQTAVVLFEKATTSGLGISWFQLPWFKSLCSHTGFRRPVNDWSPVNICTDSVISSPLQTP